MAKIILSRSDFEQRPDVWDYILDQLEVPDDERDNSTLTLDVQDYELELM